MEPGRFELREVPAPEIGAGEVLVRVRACAVCGTDLRIYRHGHPRVRLPALIGHEIVGTVERLGAGASPLPAEAGPGAAVMVTPGIPCGRCDNCLQGLFCTSKSSIGYHHPGGFAEYLAVPAAGVPNNLFPLPAGCDPVELTAAEPLACTLAGLERLGQPPLQGQALVIGAGAIGVMMARLLLRRGLGKVVLAELNAAKIRLAEGLLGPEVHLVDSRRTPLAEAAAELTGGRGFDLVVVACSSPQAQEESLALSALYGRILYFAGLPPGQAIRFDSNLLHYRLASVHGTYGSTLYHNRLAMRLAAAGITRGIVGARYPLERIGEAFRAAEAGEALKVAVEPQAGEP